MHLRLGLRFMGVGFELGGLGLRVQALGQRVSRADCEIQHTGLDPPPCKGFCPCAVTATCGGLRFGV